MTAILAWVRLELRRRWRSLLVLALLVAFATGTVLVAVAGARRGGSAVDRLVAQTLPATVAVLTNEPGFDWGAVRALPEVEALSTFVAAPYVIVGAPPGSAVLGHRVRDDEQAGVYPPADSVVMTTIERPVVLEGRLADPARADEVVVTPRFADRHGLRVGDAVRLNLYAPGTVDEGVDPRLDPQDGPTVKARIVGVIRSPWFRDEVGDTDGHLVPSPGLYARYRPNLVGASGMAASINAMVRLRGGAASVRAFAAEFEFLSGGNRPVVVNVADEMRHAADVARFEANALLAFALVAAIASVVLVGQAVARYAAASTSDLQVLRGVGMRPSESGWFATAGPALAAFAGAAAGVAAAAASSRWFPVGTARLFEPNPGYDLDLPVLLGGAVAAPVLVAGGAALASRLALRSSQRGGRIRGSAVAGTAFRLGAPVSVATGTRFALESRRGAQAVPARPALLGSVAGVLGVIAALTFADGVDDAARNPARFGQVYQLEIFLGIDGRDFLPRRIISEVVAADPRVLAVNDTRTSVAQAANIRLYLFTLDPTGGAWEPAVIEGRLPASPGEVALAPSSAAAVGGFVGSTVSMRGRVGTHTLTVTGLAFVPEGPFNDYTSGGWLTPEGFDSLFAATPDNPAFSIHTAYIALRPGAEPQVVTAQVQKAMRVFASANPSEVPGRVTKLVPFGAFATTDVRGLVGRPSPPSNLQEIREIRTLPVFLAGFLALLAIGAVGHALATAVHRRRRDLAILRAVGMTCRQARVVVVTQATVLALIGLAIGIPLGVVLGRTIWRYVAETTPVFYVAPVAGLALALIGPVALAAANLLAAVPAWRAAKLRVCEVLRAE
jgi:hypothetical protein